MFVNHVLLQRREKEEKRERREREEREEKERKCKNKWEKNESGLKKISKKKRFRSKWITGGDQIKKRVPQ